MTYEDLPPISMKEAEALLRSASAEESASILLRVALHESDGTAAERLLLAAIRDKRPEVCAAAVTSFGHLARIHGKISDAAFKALQSLRGNRTVGGLVEDTLEDVTTFVDVGGPE